MKKVYVLMFDGLAEWEAPLALCEVRNSSKFAVVTVGFTRAPVTTMAGFTLTPDIALSEVNPDDAAMLILPGGELWERGSPEGVSALLRAFEARDLPIAAICGATLEVARAGLTKGRRHTSSDQGYLEALVPEYADGALLDRLGRHRRHAHHGKRGRQRRICARDHPVLGRLYRRAGRPLVRPL